MFKKTIITLLSILIIFISYGSCLGSERIWTSKDSKIRIKAEYVTSTKDTVTLQIKTKQLDKNNQFKLLKSKIPAKWFSKKDIEWIKKHIQLLKQQRLKKQPQLNWKKTDPLIQRYNQLFDGVILQDGTYCLTPN